MDRQDRCEAGASELSDDIEDTSIIGCLTDQSGGHPGTVAETSWEFVCAERG